MGALEDKIEALLRGAAGSATAGWNEEGVAKLLSSLKFDDGTGIPREYAAGSAEQDYRNTERQNEAESERKYPNTFNAGAMLGAAPAMTAGVAAGGIPGAGLMGGARGFLSGAGHAQEGDRLNQGARAAAPAAMLSMAGAAAPDVLRKAVEGFKGGPPSGGLQPAFATAASGTSSAAAQEGLPFINMMSTAPVKRGPRMGGRATPNEDEKIIAEDRARWENENPAEAVREPNVGRPVMRPGAPDDAAQSFTPDIPKLDKTGIPSLKTGFRELAEQDAALGAEAARQPARIALEKQRIAPRDMTNYADPMQNRAALENDPTWRAMNEQIYGREFKPIARNGAEWRGVDRMRQPKVEFPEEANVSIPKPGKVPDMEKLERDLTLKNKFEDDGDFGKKFDDLVKSKKGTVEKTTVKPGGLERETLRVAPGKVETSEEDIRTMLGTMPV